jgi:hypothetical protein
VVVALGDRCVHWVESRGANFYKRGNEADRHLAFRTTAIARGAMVQECRGHLVATRARQREAGERLRRFVACGRFVVA